MAVLYPHFEANPETERQPKTTADNAELHALPGSTSQWSFLLGGAIHVIDIHEFERGDSTLNSITSHRSFDAKSGTELAAVEIVGSSDRSDDLGYVQADFQTVGSVGRQDVGFVRIAAEQGGKDLLAEPGAMPREMRQTALTPEIAKQINHIGQLSLVDTSYEAPVIEVDNGPPDAA